MILLALFLAANLGDYMPPDVQQKTGITSLTRRQQSELASWLANYMEPSKTPTAKQLTLAENYHGGRVLQLSDGSIWEVAPADVNYTGLWITPFPITLGQSTDPIYPYTLTNLVSGTSVRVRRIYTVNPPDIPKEPKPSQKDEMAPTPQPQQQPITPIPPSKTPKPQSPQSSDSPMITPDQDQLPGTTPGPGQGGPTPSPKNS